MKNIAFIFTILTMVIAGEAHSAMLKCKNEQGKIEYRNADPSDPSCVVVSRAVVSNHFPRVPVQIGMTRDKVTDMWGKPKKVSFREMPEGRIEAWLYDDGTALGFRNDVLVLIEGSK